MVFLYKIGGSFYGWEFVAINKCRISSRQAD